MPFKKIFIQDDFNSRRCSFKKISYKKIANLFESCNFKVYLSQVQGKDNLCELCGKHSSFSKEWERFSKYSSAKMFSCLWVLHCTYSQTIYSSFCSFNRYNKPICFPSFNWGGLIVFYDSSACCWIMRFISSWKFNTVSGYISNDCFHSK